MDSEQSSRDRCIHDRIWGMSGESNYSGKMVTRAVPETHKQSGNGSNFHSIAEVSTTFKQSEGSYTNRL
ncbi:hypothetical protein DPMN_003203 [Dreissena polymorpha]|uniref:Uncharacterized protein n=1 Tax=Dreissena polymorpha TaxID=45954 RepID=A0A9D4RRX3_DREPO|nr:hypothetical protein DPMN_003203 [Dreissena polymorpha]